jgi:hypothetical protein
VVVRTTNVAAARSVPTTRTGSFHQVSECCVWEFRVWGEICVSCLCFVFYHFAGLFYILSSCR